ncbi:MAG: aminoglycoside phosphotransferase family protein [Myxococcales bacterium]|nr:aminoglycoside phosphotransferase family protein [Myxococcales bacterium]MCB9731790.1 aminoglycoside phosphotransferase family protein [Deltaproteobacteria bacterium]
MGQGRDNIITPDAIGRYLRAAYGARARLLGMAPLGLETQEGLKAYGYGRPLHVRYEVDGERREAVLRTMAPDPFGHDRRSDRVGALVGAYDTFGGVAGHVQPLAVGTIDADGQLVPLASGEPFFLTTYAPGTLYARDLGAAAEREHATPRDLGRAVRLARWLVDLHAGREPAGAYARDLRDTLGSGEGIFGLCDSYPADDPVATPARLEALERAAVGWRWRLRDRGARARRTHGDFHPFNLLFDDDDHLTVLDMSRGGAGEPADDVACLTLNYVFFALRTRGAFTGALRELWGVVWQTYLEESGDRAITEVVAPWFAWRALVLASPVWYPDVADDVRNRLLSFAERLLDGATFDPSHPEPLLEAAPERRS